MLTAAKEAFESFDSRGCSYEWHLFVNNSKFVKVIIGFLFILKTLDWLTSVIAFQEFGLAEGNPLARRIFDVYGLWFALFLGYVVTAVYVLVLEWLRSSIPLKVYWFMYVLIFCMYSFVVVNNFCVLYYYF